MRKRPLTSAETAMLDGLDSNGLKPARKPEPINAENAQKWANDNRRFYPDTHKITGGTK